MLIREFSVQLRKEGRPGISPNKSYPVLGMTGTLNDTAFFIPDDNGKVTFIKLGDAYFGGMGNGEVTDDVKMALMVAMERIEALQTKLNSLQGQVTALKGKKVTE